MIYITPPSCCTVLGSVKMRPVSADTSFNLAKTRWKERVRQKYRHTYPRYIKDTDKGKYTQSETQSCTHPHITRLIRIT